MKGTYLIASMIVCSLFIACAGSQNNSAGTKTDGKLITSQNLKDISGIEWNLKQMKKDNNVITLVENSETTFSCNENGNVTGRATINRYSSNLKLQDDGNITWNKAFIMTRMAGPPELMQQESNFTQALMQTSRMYRKDSKLVLLSHDRSTVLEFEQVK